MDFPREKLLKKYIDIYEEYIARYEPDIEVMNETTKYVRFNDAWRELNPFEKLLIPRLINRKNGLDYTSYHYYRKSQTITNKGHVSEETLSHLAQNGICLT